MTRDEREFLQKMSADAMKILGACGNIERHAETGSKQATRARRASLMALQLATDANTRIRDAELAADQADDERFDLGALSVDLATTAPEHREE